MMPPTAAPPTVESALPPIAAPARPPTPAPITVSRSRLDMLSQAERLPSTATSVVIVSKVRACSSVFIFRLPRQAILSARCGTRIARTPYLQYPHRRHTTRIRVCALVSELWESLENVSADGERPPRHSSRLLAL